MDNCFKSVILRLNFSNGYCRTHLSFHGRADRIGGIALQGQKTCFGTFPAHFLLEDEMLKEAMEFFPHSVGNRGTDVESRGVGRHATHGFDKKSQKTPRTEITLAKKIRDEYYQSR